MDIIDLIALIEREPGCTIYTPSAIPSIEPYHVLPDDVRRFYQRCGGAVLFEDSTYAMYIVPPEDVVQTNVRLYKDQDETLFNASMNDRSSSWYIIGDYENGDYVSIDFSREKAGWCYDSSFGGHGVAGSCEIVAKSFTEFLQHCLLDSNKGEYVYWEHPNFISLGDAYD